MACEKGSLALFESAMAKNEENFLRTGIYLVMEKLKNVVFRNFFMGIHEKNEKNHIMKLDVLTKEYNKALEEVKTHEDEDDKISITGME